MENRIISAEHQAVINDVRWSINHARSLTSSSFTAVHSNALSIGVYALESGLSGADALKTAKWLDSYTDEPLLVDGKLTYAAIAQRLVELKWPVDLRPSVNRLAGTLMQCARTWQWYTLFSISSTN